MKKLLAVSATAVLASLALAVPVLAATPPQLPHDITVFPQRDMVAADGYAINTRLDITVRRPGVGLVGRAIGTTDRTGFLEVNHPGGICWGAGAGSSLQVTPDIQPEDVVTVNPAGPRTEADSSRVINVQVNKDDPSTSEIESGAAFINANGDVEVHGTAQTAAGRRVNLDLMEQRIINPDFRDQELNPDSRIIKRDIRADAEGGLVKGVDEATGTLFYDSPTFNRNDPNRFDWTAIYTGLNDTEAQLAVEGQTRILSWMQTNNADDRLGLTIYEEDEVSGPGMGGCPPGPGPAVPPAAPNAPILYDNDPADDDPLNPTYQKYNTESFANHVDLLDAAVAGTDLTQLHEVVVFPERDMVVAEGYDPGTNLEIVVRRPDTGDGTAGIVGSVRGVTGRDGGFEVNHPGGGTWSGQTPNIKPGDIVDVIQYHEEVNDMGTPETTDDTLVPVADSGETQRVMNVTANPARIVDPNQALTGDRRLVITGTAFKSDGTPVTANDPEADLMEQRIINPELKDTIVGRRDIRVSQSEARVPAGVTATLRFRDNGTWIATYRGLDRNGAPGQRNALVVAAEGQTRVLGWLATDAAGERYGITIFEVGEVGGPGMGGASPQGETDLFLPVVE